jgi:hypothetical protein
VFRDAGANVKHEVPVAAFWQPVVHEPAFQMGVWSSQRV